MKKLLWIFFTFFFSNSSLKSQTIEEKAIKDKLTTLKNDDLKKAELLIDLGNIVMDRSNKAAIGILREALAIGQLKKDIRILRMANQSLATANYGDGNLYDALVYAKGAYNFAQQTKHPHDIFQSVTVLADIYIDQAKNTMAKEYIGIAKDLYENKYDSLNTPEFYPMVNGKYLIRNLNINDAIINYYQAIEKAKNANRDSLVFDMKRNLGQALFMKGKVEDGVKELMECKNYYSKINRENGLANTYLALGTSYTFINNLPKASENYDNSIAIFKKNDKLPFLLNAYMSKANLLYRNGHFYEALGLIDTAETLTNKVENIGASILINLYRAHIYYMATDTVSYSKFYKRAEYLAEKTDFQGINQLMFLAKLKPTKLLSLDSLLTIELRSVTKEIPKELVLNPVGNLLKNKHFEKAINSNIDTLLYSKMKHKDSLQYNLSILKPDTNFITKLNQQALDAETKFNIPELNKKIENAVNEKNQIKKSNNAVVISSLVGICVIIGLLAWRSRKQKVEKKKMLHSVLGTFTALQQNVKSTLANDLSDEKLNEINFKINQSVSFFKTFEISAKSSKFSAKQVFEELLKYFASANSNLVEVKYDIDEKIATKFIKPITEILQELLINSVKYGVKQGEGKLVIGVSLKNYSNTLNFHYYDNGKGFKGNEPYRSGSLGIEIIKQNVKRINATYKFWNDDGFHFSCIKS